MFCKDMQYRVRQLTPVKYKISSHRGSNGQATQQLYKDVSLNRLSVLECC